MHHFDTHRVPRAKRWFPAVRLQRLAAALLVVLALPVPAQQPTVAIPKIEFESYTLPNGLDVILHVDRKLPIVHVNEWFHVGSKNEKRGRTGFAHLFEHMMFQGSKNAPSEYFSYAERAGANLREGGVNGTTSADRTNYFVTAPSGSLEYLLWLEADRLATLPEMVTKANLDNQRDVVKNERRQGLENTPYGRWFKLMLENLHPSDHPYSWPAIGSHEDLTAASVEDVNEFFRTYYAPNNLSLVIAGDFDPAEARRLVEKYFGSIPPGPPLDRPQRSIPKLNGEKIVEAFDRVPQDRVYMIWPSAEYFSADEAPLDLAAAILTDGLSSRLQKAMVYDRQLASDVTAFHYATEISGAFIVIATARPGVDLAELERIVSEEIARLAGNGPTEAELQRAKTKQQYNFITGLERIGGFGGKADLLNQYNTFLGTPANFEADLRRYQSVTAGQLRDVVDRLLDTDNRLLLRFRPETSKRTDGDIDRAKVPALGKDQPFRTPEVSSAKLENGMTVFAVSRRDLPKVAVTFLTRAGSAADPRGKEGVALLAAQTLDRGTKTRNALEIDDAFGNLGIQLTGYADREVTVLSTDLLASSLPAALEIMADVILHPSFPAAELEREQKLHLDALGQESRNGNFLAGRIRPMLMFGADHPYGRPARGLPSTVAAITREDLVRHHADWWKPGSSAIIFAGDISLDEAVRLTRAKFGAWSGGSAPVVPIPQPKPARHDRIYVVDRTEAAQTVVSLMLVTPPRKISDFYALSLADAVYGGAGASTRLNQNLREDKGYAYGAFSVHVLNRDFGTWWAGGSVQTNKTRESVIEFRKELDALAGAKPVSAEELDSARLTRVRGYAQQFESLGRVAGQIATLWTLGLPLTELQREPQALGEIKLADVNAAARKYAVPSQATLLLVGDLTKIGPSLRELGELVVLDVEGKEVAK